MKKYIKSAINPNMTLLDWINQNKEKGISEQILIVDETPFTDPLGNTLYYDYDELGSTMFECPGVVFDGTFEQLVSGDNELTDCFDESPEIIYSRYIITTVEYEEDFITIYVGFE